MEREILIFGSSGLLGSSLIRQFFRRGVSATLIHALPWSEIGAPELCTSQAALKEKISQELTSGMPCDFVFAGGLTDPKAPIHEIYYSNYDFPQRVIRAMVHAHPENRFLTFGSILENFPALCSRNSYLNSKLKLGDWVQKFQKETGAGKRLLHVRLHTLYGKRPKPHMFLGQIAHALQTGSPFLMSSGEQLREYHHVDDVALAVSQLLGQAWDFPTSVLELNSGKPIRLSELALDIFRHFQKQELLKIGEIPRAVEENAEKTFPMSPATLLPASRDPVSGVIQWLEETLK